MFIAYIQTACLLLKNGYCSLVEVSDVCYAYKNIAAFPFLDQANPRSSLTLSNRLCPSLARYHSASVALVLASLSLCVCESAERQSSDEILV